MGNQRPTERPYLSRIKKTKRNVSGAVQFASTSSSRGTATTTSKTGVTLSPTLKGIVANWMKADLTIPTTVGTLTAWSLKVFDGNNTLGSTNGTKTTSATLTIGPQIINDPHAKLTIGSAGTSVTGVALSLLGNEVAVVGH